MWQHETVHAGPIRILQVSDLHLVADPRRAVYDRFTDDTLNQVLAGSAPADVIVATGDITDDSSPEGYRRAADRLRMAAPICFWVPGNHDRAARMGHLPPGRFPASRSLGDWDLVLLDSCWPGHDEGRLGSQQLTWLDTHLAGGVAPAVVALHHPPLSACGSPGCQLTDRDDLVGVVRAHPRARVVLSGHNHRPGEQVLGHTTFLGAPSTCRQLQHEPPGHAWTDEQPAGRLVTLHPDGRFTHHLTPAAPATGA